ncbi:MAG: hypothetical protein AAGU27_05970 [Dehalobacterium sp.]
MKAKNYFAMMLLLSILVFGSACSNVDDKSTGATNIDGNSEGNFDPPEGQPGPNQGRADLFGQVKSIDGSEVTILVAEMPQLREKPGSPPDQNKESAGSQNTEDKREENLPEEKRNPVNDKITFTGEIQKVVIPEGTSIESGMGEKSTELKLSDIQEGMLVQIWFEEEDDSESKTIKNVRVLPMSS